MNFNKIYALGLRHLYLIMNSFPRVLDLIYWPTVQIFLWADSPERAFVERTSAAIMVLLIFLVLLNLVAIYLRNKLEKKW